LIVVFVAKGKVAAATRDPPTDCCRKEQEKRKETSAKITLCTFGGNNL